MKLFSLSGGLFSSLLEMASYVHPEKTSTSPMMPDTIQFIPVDKDHIRVIIFCPFNGVDMTLAVENCLEKPVEIAIMQLKRILPSETVSFELDGNDLVVSLTLARITQRFSQVKVWEDRHTNVPEKMDKFKEQLKDGHVITLASDLIQRAIREAGVIHGDLCFVFNGPEDPVLIRPRNYNGSFSSVDVLVMPKRNS